MSKNLNPEQLVKDGFVQLKSLRQLQKQGILPKIPKCYAPFRKTKSDIYMTERMYNYLGRIVHVERLTINRLGIVAEGWAWPLEAVQC